MTPVRQVEGTAARLRVAVLQTAPTRGATDANLLDIEKTILTLPHVDLVVTPELSLFGFVFHPDQLPQPLTAEDPRLHRLGGHGPAVSVGMAEHNPAGAPYNSAVLIGETISVQRKLHLVSYSPWNEHQVFASGDHLAKARLHGVPLATLICNDAWHPVMPWLAAHSGAEVLLIPAASLGEGPANTSAQSWDVILRHTARILQCFVVFANRVGIEDGQPFWGGSRIIDPTGAVLAQAGDGPETIQAELDLASLRRLREEVPILHELRPDLIGKLMSQLKGEAPDV